MEDGDDVKTLGLLLLGLASACSHEPRVPAVAAQPAAGAAHPRDVLDSLAHLSQDDFCLRGDWRLSPQENRVELEVRADNDGTYRLAFLIQERGAAERRTCTARVSDGVLRLDGPVSLPGSRSIAALYPLRVLGEDALLPDVFLPEYEAGRVRRGDSEFAFKREFLDTMQPFSGPDDVGY